MPAHLAELCTASQSHARPANHARAAILKHVLDQGVSCKAPSLPHKMGCGASSALGPVQQTFALLRFAVDGVEFISGLSAFGGPWSSILRT